MIEQGLIDSGTPKFQGKPKVKIRSAIVNRHVANQLQKQYQIKRNKKDVESDSYEPNENQMNVGPDKPNDQNKIIRRMSAKTLGKRSKLSNPSKQMDQILETETKR